MFWDFVELGFHCITDVIVVVVNTYIIDQAHAHRVSLEYASKKEPTNACDDECFEKEKPQVH